MQHLTSVLAPQINEAFAAQTLSCAKALKLDTEKLNVNGGATALGHPLGASGSRITAHLVHELRSGPLLAGRLGRLLERHFLINKNGL